LLSLKSNFTAGFLNRLGRIVGVDETVLIVLKRLEADYEVIEVLMMTSLNC